MKKNKIYVVTLIIFILIVILLAAYFFSYRGKTNRNKDYVYLKEENSNAVGVHKLPHINLNGRKVKAINKTIEKKYKDNLSLDQSDFTYTFEVDNNILSLVIEEGKINDETELYEYSFSNYNIDLKNNSLIKDSDLIKKYGFKSENIYTSIDSTFKQYYQEEIEQGYVVKEECDYDCYLELRELDLNIAKSKMAIKNKQLVTYLPFNIYSYYDEEDFFIQKGFAFVIKK